MNANENVYARLARFVLRHRAAVAIAVTVLTVLAGIVGIPPKVDSNLLNLLPESDPVVGAIRRINEQEGGLNFLTLTFEAKDPAQLDPFLDDLAARFEAVDGVEFAMHELDPSLTRQIGLLQLDPQELAKLNGRLQGALALGPAINPFVLQPLLAMGPLTDKIAKVGDNAMFREREQGTGRLIVRPVRPATDPDFARRFMADVRRVVAEAAPESKGMALVWMGGPYRHSVEDVEGIQHDLSWTGVGSFLAILGMMIVAFRSARAMLIVFPPLIVANVLTLGFAKLAVGPLNTFTSFSIAILFGMGIDYAIHLVGRTRELRTRGLPTEEAIVEAWSVVGPPSAAAAWTTVAGFLALTLAQFVGFQQLGLILAVGLALCFLSMLVLLPVLIVWLDRETRPLLGAASADHEAVGGSYRWSPGLFAILAAATLVAGAWMLPRLEYEYDVSALRRDGLAYDELSERERALAGQSYSPLVVFFEDDVALAEAQRVMREKLAAGEFEHIASVVSLADVLPPDQAARNVEIERLVGLVEDPNLKYLPPVLVKQLAPLRGLEVRELSRADLPKSVLMLLGANETTESRMLLLPKGNQWDVRNVREMAREIESVMPDQVKTGEYLGILSMFDMAFADAPRIFLVAFLLVGALTWWELKKPLATAAAVGALVAGMIWALVVLHLVGVKISMVNLTGIPILLGLGVDTVIHLLHRLEEEGPERGVLAAWRTTGVAAFLSMATTVASFASLSLASSRAVRSMGVLVAVGLLTVFVVGGLVLTVGWTAKWRVTGRTRHAARETQGG